MKTFPTLHKFDTKGKVRVWKTYADEDEFYMIHGQDGGKLQTKVTKCKGKNIGKSNETTPEQQAELEAKSKWTKQIEREDYAQDVNDSGKQTRCMLAHDFLKVPHRVDFSKTIVQPKLDGLRLVAGYRWVESSDIELMTRKGETYSIPHFQDPIEKLLHIINWDLTKGQCMGLDGEVYIHGMKLQNIISLARKNKPESIQLKYYLFDLVIFDIPFHERHKLLDDALIIYEERHGSHPFVLVENTIVYNEKSMKEVHDEYVGNFYEGAIIRHIDGLYKKGRSADLFKYKKFFTDEFKIIDMFEDDNQNAMLVVKLKDGKSMNLTPKRNHIERKKMLLEPEKWIGKYITVRYQSLTEDNVPTFATGRELRECDDEGNPLI